MTPPERSVVYVVAKAPRPGETKTRLCPPLTPAAAAELARAFLLDTLETVQAAGIEPRIICRSVAERAALATIARGATAHVQDGTGLGDALESAFRRALADEFAAAGVLGADTPTLPPAVLRQAFHCLRDECDVALGASEDGGYYLLAARAVHPTLFREMAWSTSTVAEETLARSQAAGLRAHLLPTWYDVDDAASLRRLRDDLAQAANTAPHTRAALARMSALLAPLPAR